MQNIRLRRFGFRSARDFLCSLIVFSTLFTIMAPAGPGEAPIPVLSLVSEAFAGTVDTAPVAAPLAISPAAPSLSPSAKPLISTVLALLFASMMTLNLRLMRYLRRANASSRRGVWREG
jgi:hypothetical protein